MKPFLLIVDDDEEIRTQLRWALMQTFDLCEAGDRASGIQVFREKQPEVVLLDLGLPPSPGTPQEGFLLLGEILASNRATRIVVISGQGEKENAMRAIAEGAYDFFCKPVNVDELKVIISRAYHVGRLEREHEALARNHAQLGFDGMLGASVPMQQVFATVRKVAASEIPVLVLGESGTGKEVVALTIHRQSARGQERFVAINCGAIPETLIESELFGHERGAFTGAHTQRLGRIESAQGGTLFLDEIGELPLPLQVKLLRFLQEKEIERLGGRKPIHVDARVIAATNVDLEKAMREGRFREDLFYRLAVVVVHLPPLRQRDQDAELLAEVFLKRFGAEQGRKKLRLTREASQAIQQYSWPGNVRELENRIKRAVVMSDGARVTPEDLGLAGSVASTSIPLKDARENVERDLVTKALRKHGGRITAAAAELGISRPTFYELMEKLGIQKEPSKDTGEPLPE